MTNPIELAYFKVQDNPNIDADGLTIERAHHGYSRLRGFEDDGVRILKQGSKLVRVSTSDSGELLFHGWRLPLTVDVGELKDSIKFMILVATVGEAYEHDSSEEIEKRKEAMRLAEEERKRKLEEEEERWEERKQLLLTELLGEYCRVRLRTGTTTPPVIVRAKQIRVGTEEEEFVPYFEYVYDKDDGKTTNFRSARLLDVRVGSRFQEVWDDGTEDLPYHRDFKRKKIKKFGS